MKTKILITFAFCLILSACQPSHIQQQEVRLKEAIQQRNLTAQYDALKILADHTPANWNEAFSQVNKSRSKLQQAQTLLSKNELIDAYIILHEIKKQYNYKQVNTQLKNLKDHTELLSLITEIHRYNKYLTLNPLETILVIHASQWNTLTLNETYSKLINHHNKIKKLTNDVEKRNYSSIKILNFIKSTKRQTTELESAVAALLKKQLSDFSISSITRLETLYVTTTENLTLFDSRIVIPMMKPMIKTTLYELQHWNEQLNNTRITLSTFDSSLAPTVSNVYQAFTQLTNQANDYATYTIDGKQSLQTLKQLQVAPIQTPNIKSITINKDIVIFSQLLTEYAYLYRFTS